MGIAVNERVALSPRSLARMAGAFQLLEALTAVFGQIIVLNRLVVKGDAAATAAKIMGHEDLFWEDLRRPSSVLCSTSLGGSSSMSYLST
jgi:hypothetical protein